jgi:hypothetical protein
MSFIFIEFSAGRLKAPDFQQDEPQPSFAQWEADITFQIRSQHGRVFKNLSRHSLYFSGGEE